jgi:hypothetical protein
LKKPWRGATVIATAPARHRRLKHRRKRDGCSTVLAYGQTIIGGQARQARCARWAHTQGLLSESVKQIIYI